MPVAIAAVDGGAEVRIAIPTFNEVSTDHNPTVENIPAAVEGVVEGLTQAGDASAAIEGISIFAEYTTVEEEWRQFEQFWVQR